MHMDPRRHTGLSLALLATFALGACRRDSGAATDTTLAQMRAGAADSTIASPAAAVMTPAALSDANIVAMLDEANMADSALGADALPGATRASVKDFARLMMGEHHALRRMVQALAGKQNIVARLPADDPFPQAVRDEQAALSAAPRGVAFDSTYIAHEIGIHQAVIDWAGTAMSQAQNPALRQLITAAAPTLQNHLDHARVIQRTLAASRTTADE